MLLDMVGDVRSGCIAPRHGNGIHGSVNDGTFI